MLPRQHHCGVQLPETEILRVPQKHRNTEETCVWYVGGGWVVWCMHACVRAYMCRQLRVHRDSAIPYEPSVSCRNLCGLSLSHAHIYARASTESSYGTFYNII